MNARQACLLLSLPLLATSQSHQADKLAVLRRAFEDPLPGQRLEAAKEVARQGKKAIPMLHKTLRSGSVRARRAAMDASIAMGKQAAPLQKDLRHSLEDKVAWLRAGAAEALGRLGPLSQKTIRALVPHAADPDLFVRISVMQSLSKRGITPHTEFLLQAAVLSLEVRESGWAAKRFAVELLRRKGRRYRAAIPALLRVFRESPEGMWDQGATIAQLLIDLGEKKQVLEILATRIEDPERGGYKNSLRIIVGLGKLAHSLRPRLQALLHEAKRGHVRKALEQTLQKLSAK